MIILRILVTIISTLLYLNLYGQNKAQFVFFDACTNEVLELPYQLWSGGDSTIQVKSGQTVELEPNYYQLSLEMIWDDMYTGFFFDIIIKEGKQIDTLYLQQARSYGTMILHPPPGHFKHYCCDKLCDGTVIETDSNGVIRFRGKFKEGIPTSNLKYYNELGERIRTEVYSNGNLKRIKD